MKHISSFPFSIEKSSIFAFHLHFNYSSNKEKFAKREKKKKDSGKELT